MGDQAATGGCQKARHRQTIPGKTSVLTADPRGDNQHRGHGWRAHGYGVQWSTMASSRIQRCPSGKAVQVVMAQRSGAPC